MDLTQKSHSFVDLQKTIMNKTISILTFGLLIQFSYGQITTTKVSEKKNQISTEPYDSLQNFLGKDVYKYVGHDLYLKGKSESLRKYGYEKFVKDYQYKGNKRQKNTYKCCDGYNSKYDELTGKYFNVIAIHKHPKTEEFYDKYFYLEIKEKESGDIVYYEYDSQFKHSFPFIVAGFFVKQKQLNVNKEFVVRGKNWLTNNEPMSEINTGQTVSFEPGSKWKCVDLTIDEKYFFLSLIMENEKGEKIPLPLEFSDNTNFVFLDKDAEKYKKSYGDENWTKILNGKVVVGFTKKMVLLSWGKPKKINKSSYGDQWVYQEKYLYFENGKLKSFN